VALGKKATQSSQYESHGPALTVDGSLDTNMHSAPSDTPRWWQVDLGISHYLTHTVIYNAKEGKASLVECSVYYDCW